MAIILSPTVFFQCEALVSHLWKTPMSHSVPLFEDSLSVPLVYHQSSFFKENSWIYLSLSWEGRGMDQNVSTFIIFLISGFLSITHLPWYPAQKAKQCFWPFCKKKKMLGNTQVHLFGKHCQHVLMAITTQGSSAWAKISTQGWMKRSGQQTQPRRSWSPAWGLCERP